jgi:Tfp pilus assembly protein PilN
MEITLNLLPPYLQQQRQSQRRRQTRILAAALAVAPLLLAYGLLNIRIQMLQQRVARLDRGVAALSHVAATTRRLESESDDLRRREEALSRMTVRLPRGSAVLVELSTLVPTDVWFTSVSIANGRFTIVGQTLSESGVSVLTARLASARFVTAPSVKYVREESAGTRRTYTFEIDGTMRTEGQHP